MTTKGFRAVSGEERAILPRDMSPPNVSQSGEILFGCQSCDCSSSFCKISASERRCTGKRTVRSGKESRSETNSAVARSRKPSQILARTSRASTSDAGMCYLQQRPAEP